MLNGALGSRAYKNLNENSTHPKPWRPPTDYEDVILRSYDPYRIYTRDGPQYFYRRHNWLEDDPFSSNIFWAARKGFGFGKASLRRRRGSRTVTDPNIFRRHCCLPRPRRVLEVAGLQTAAPARRLRDASGHGHARLLHKSEGVLGQHAGEIHRQEEGLGMDVLHRRLGTGHHCQDRCK